VRKQRNDQAFIKRTDLCGDGRKGKSKKGGSEGAHLERKLMAMGGASRVGWATKNISVQRNQRRAVQEFLYA